MNETRVMRAAQWRESTTTVSESGAKAESIRGNGCTEPGNAEVWAATEATLIAAARSDPTAFEPIYRHYVGPIYRYCALRLRARQAAEDATSEIFLRALRGLSGYRQGHFAAWLFQIAHNVIIDSYRRERHSSSTIDVPELVDQDLGPDEAIIARDDADRLRATIQQLPDAQRTAVELQLAGWTTEQIGAVLSKSPATMRVFRFRALKQLRALLDDSEPDSEGEERQHD